MRIIEMRNRFAGGNKFGGWWLNFVIIVLALLFAKTNVNGQGEDLQRAKMNLQKLETRLSQLRIEKEKLEADADSLANKITLLKKKKALNILESRKLEGYLREAQQLASKIEALDKKMTQSKDSLNLEIELVVKLYHKKIEEILSQMKEIKGKGFTEKEKELGGQLLSLRREQAEMRSRVKKVTGLGSQTFPVIIRADDSPRQIREKADLVKDQEDEVRAKAKSIDKSIADLEQELKIRERAKELLDDLSLFDQRDEITLRATPVRPKETEEGWVDVADISTRNKNAQQQEFLTPHERTIFPENLRKLPVDDIDALIKELEIEKKRLSSKADSLAVVAEQFYKKAELLEGEIRKKK